MGFLDWLKGLFSADRPSVEEDEEVFVPEPRIVIEDGPPERPASPLSALDATAFQPLSASDAREFIRGQGASWKNAYFDSLHVIPSASLARIQVIDRTMVRYGLITAEELAEIHEIGRRWDAAQGSDRYAQELAEQSVQRSEAERQALKAQRKAEAAERAKRRAEEVAHRRATDIIFLGRGVSRGLADRRCNPERLTAAGLPVLGTPASVAEALGLPIPRLRWLAFHSEATTQTHYVRFTVPKKSGGVRQLAAPHREMAAAQRWILRNILEHVPLHDAAHGFVKGRSTVTNAHPHVGQAVVVNVDLKDFFPTITFPRVRGVFEELGYSPAAATILGLLCTECPRRDIEVDGQTLHCAAGPRALPQGACTSPALSNLVARRLDARLSGLARKLGWVYTRYADDLTLSAAPAEADGMVGYVLARLRHIAADEGFVLNPKKTRVQRQSTAQQVTGIVVNQRPGVPRKLIRRLRAILHNAEREGLAAQNRERLPHFEAWLEGMLAYVHMVNPDQARPLLTAWNELRGR